MGGRYEHGSTERITFTQDRLLQSLDVDVYAHSAYGKKLATLRIRKNGIQAFYATLKSVLQKGHQNVHI